MKRVMPWALILGMMVAPIAAFADDHIADDAKKAEPLTKGKMIPDVTVKDTEGKDVKLRELVAEQPRAIIFYRGGWCPYCNKHLKEMGRRADELKELGYGVIAIAPDTPEKIAEHLKKQRLDYAIYSDASLDAIVAFGLAFRLDADTQKRYEKMLDAWSGGMNDGVLPVPALYLVNADGEIVYSHYDPDYSKRVDADEVLAAAKENMKADS